jgi:uncharacterized protein (TIGR03086 family)
VVTEARPDVDIIALYERAVPVAQRVIDGIRPDQIDAPTPCTEWDVRALLAHLVGFLRPVAAGIAGRPLPDPAADLLGANPAAAFAAAARDLGAALRAPGALERAYPMPWGESKGADLARMSAADIVIHAWDLANATGQLHRLDPALCEEVLAWGRTVMKDEYRTPEAGFGPEVAVSADAPACARLAAFYGREP